MYGEKKFENIEVRGRPRAGLQVLRRRVCSTHKSTCFKIPQFKLFIKIKKYVYNISLKEVLVLCMELAKGDDSCYLMNFYPLGWYFM